MDTSLPSRPLVSAVSFLSFTALTQVLLALWVMDRIGIKMASSILLGFVLFGLLVGAIAEVLDRSEREQRAFGARRLSK